jgi:LysM repeat protein
MDGSRPDILRPDEKAQERMMQLKKCFLNSYRKPIYIHQKTVRLLLFILLITITFMVMPVTVSAAQALSKAGQYIVKSGDSLYRIGKEYGIGAEALKDLNKLKSDIIFPGQILLVSPEFFDHRVNKGDTLYEIGRKYGVTVNELKGFNKITSDMIFPGQVIKVPSRTPRKLKKIMDEMGIYYGGSRMSIVTDKYDHTLSLYIDGIWLKSYHIELGEGGLGDKAVAGDRRTPEGTFYICQKAVLDPPQEYFGTRWLRLSYPYYEDAERGLKQGLIDKQQYNSITASLDKRWIPLQNTKLGGGVGIHGGNTPKLGRDWTWGCIGMNDGDLEEFYDYVDSSTKVMIRK